MSISLLATFAQGTPITIDPNGAYPAGPASTPFPWGLFAELWFIWLAVAIIGVVTLWKVFQKAGRPGWASIVPFYSMWVLFEVVGMPGWLIFLCFVPLVNIAFLAAALFASFRLAKAFGKSDVFAVCNILFPYVTMFILALDKSAYRPLPPVLSDSAGAPRADNIQTAPVRNRTDQQ